MQAWSYPSYNLLHALEETIGRSRAINLYKKFITNYYIENPPAVKGNFLSLQKHFEERTTGDTTSSEWVLVHTMLGEGKYAFKNKNCPTLVDSMKNLPDLEFKYLVCCYSDYEKFRQTRDDHVILTMEHTLMEGDPYCSRVLHDTRIDYDLRHPPKEFLDNFEPGNESVAAKYYKEKNEIPTNILLHPQLDLILYFFSPASIAKDNQFSGGVNGQDKVSL
jgi:hypothetical protein